jgi:hypothetical protein
MSHGAPHSVYLEVTFVGVDVCAFESTGIYSFNRHKMPENLFSILDAREI